MSRDGKKTGGRDFKPGNNANPAGHPRMPEELRNMKKLTKNSFSILANRYMHLTIPELEMASESQNLPAIDVTFAKMFLEAAKNGHLPHQVINRQIGKVSEKVQHSTAKPTVMKLIGEDAVMFIGPKKQDEEE